MKGDGRMTGKQGPPTSPMEPVDYDTLVDAFNQALIHTCANTM